MSDPRKALRLLLLGAITITGGVAMFTSSINAAAGSTGEEPAPMKVERLDPALDRSFRTSLCWKR